MEHVDHHGRIDVADPHRDFRYVTVEHLPEGWAAEAHSITLGWRRPVAPKSHQ
jgi:hypothetical protein